MSDDGEKKIKIKIKRRGERDVGIRQVLYYICTLPMEKSDVVWSATRLNMRVSLILCTGNIGTVHITGNVM